MNHRTVTLGGSAPPASRSPATFTRLSSAQNTRDVRARAGNQVPGTAESEKLKENKQHAEDEGQKKERLTGKDI